MVGGGAPNENGVGNENRREAMEMKYMQMKQKELETKIEEK
jgi:hypothetical protein